MSEPMNKRPTKDCFVKCYDGQYWYYLPKSIASRYRVEDREHVSPDAVFAGVNAQFTKPGALLQGLRHREGLTQVELAKQLLVTQSDISQMERGVRRIGRTVACRIEALFGVHYRAFLD